MSGYSNKTLFWTFAAGFITAMILSAATALWITKAPIPFVAKVQQTQSAVDEKLLDGRMDPNKKLYTDGQGADISAATNVSSVQTKEAAKPAEPVVEDSKYWIHAGAFSQNTDAESMRARIAFIGLDAQISYRNEGGQRLYRVRIGPFDTEAQALEIKQSLADNSIQGSVIRMKAP